jgi:hypothetical protein
MSTTESTKMKVSSVSLEAFVEYVKKKDPELCKKAVEEGHLDISAICKRVKEEIVADFSILTGVTKAASEIRIALEMALAKEVPCIYLGMKDRPGSNMPVTMALMKLSGEADRKGTRATLFEASTFDPSLETAEGSKVHLDGMGKIVLKLKENVKYDKFEVVQLTRYERLPSDKMNTILASVINDPRKFSEDDKYKTIILMGRIRGIYPVNILAKDEDDKWSSVGEYPLLVSNELEGDRKVLTPVFKVGLEPIHGITVRVSFGPRKFTDPVVDVADLMECVKTAVHDIKAPKEQALAVSEIIHDRDVILVGSIQKVSSNKSGATFMEIDGFSIIDAPDKFDWFSSGAPAATTETPASSPAGSPAATTATPAAASPAVSPEAPPAASPAAPPAATAEVEHLKKKPTKAAKKEDAAPADAPKGVTKFDDVKAAIQAYCEKLNMKPTQLTVESVKDLVCPAAKAGVIEAALDEINNP